MNAGIQASGGNGRFVNDEVFKSICPLLIHGGIVLGFWKD